MPSSKYPLSPALRAPNSPSINPSRQNSIVEMLSSPPPLEDLITNLDINSQTTTGLRSNSNINSNYNNNSNNNSNINNNNNNNNTIIYNSNLHPASYSPSTSSISSLLSGNIPTDSNENPLTDTDNENSELPHSESLSNVSTNLSEFPSENISRNPSTCSTNSQFLNGASLEWKDIQLSELVEKNKLIIIDANTSVEKAFETLVNHGLTSVPVENFKNDLNCLTFDYTDLNAYLLLVLNKLNVEDLKNLDYTPKDQIPILINNAQRGQQVPVKFVIKLTNKNPFIKLLESDTLSTVVEILGTGVHRIAIINDNKLTGILSQRRLVKYLWDNARRFPSMEPILSSSIKSLHIGSSNPVTIYGDQLLIEALMTMHNLKMSSLAVVDRNYHLLGNISVTDVRLVSTSSKSNLLYKSCLHFISVILNSRGLENGKDSFPIFHVTNQTSLGRAIAKMVATKSHRLWIIKPESNNKPQTSSQELKHHHVHHSHSSHSSHSSHHFLHQEEDNHRTGKLIGVLSLTDILSLFAKTLGKAHVEPNLARIQRRRSSSGVASINTNSSLEMFRRSISEQSDKSPTDTNHRSTSNSVSSSSMKN
ncbi:hypothetical protein CANINC_002169 [Pichia inconspicua]|uniref:CBS domain-containing protein n=1 Tax=Pichia inconspicua TaxID=52247 RepID=A0A4T0X1X9_9ASCO|nr:hypothetical protein CANINC_002169 [[Candida] inconspicua]